MKSNPSIEVFSTCPPSSRIPQEQYLDRLIKIAQWSEAAGCTASPWAAGGKIYCLDEVGHTFVFESGSNRIQEFAIVHLCFAGKIQSLGKSFPKVGF